MSQRLPPSVHSIQAGADRRREFWDYRGVAQRGSLPVALILLVLILGGATVAIIAPGAVSDVPGSGPSAGQRVATATVVAPVPCGGSTPGDLVEVQVNGVRTQARLDGCGHNKGEQLQVEVPANASTRDLVVRIHTSVSASAGDASSRLNWVLLTLAAIAGSGYMLMLRSRPAPRLSAKNDDGLSAHLG